MMDQCYKFRIFNVCNILLPFFREFTYYFFCIPSVQRVNVFTCLLSFLLIRPVFLAFITYYFNFYFFFLAIKFSQWFFKLLCRLWSFQTFILFFNWIDKISFVWTKKFSFRWCDKTWKVCLNIGRLEISLLGWCLWLFNIKIGISVD